LMSKNEQQVFIKNTNVFYLIECVYSTF